MKYSVVFLACFIMAAESIIVELFYVIGNIPTLVVALIGLPVAGVILLIFTKNKNNIKVFREAWKPILFMSIMFAITEWMWYDSVQHIGAAKVTLIEVPLETISVVVLAWVFLRERLSLIKIFGAVLVMVGVVISINITTSLSNQEFGIGEIEIIIASITAAINIIIITKLLEKYDTAQITGFSLLFAGLMIQFQWFFIREFESFEWSWFLLLVPITPLLVFFLQNMSYKKVGASLTSIIVATHMILVVVLQVILFHIGVPVALPENLLYPFVGGSVSIVGIVLIICSENISKKMIRVKK